MTSKTTRTKTVIWHKMLRKYRNLQIRISDTNNTRHLKKLEQKLKSLSKRLITIRKKWTVPVSAIALSAWLNTSVQAQDTFNLSQDIDAGSGFSVLGVEHKKNNLNGSYPYMGVSTGDFDGDGLQDYFTNSYIIWGTGEVPQLDTAQLDQGEYTVLTQGDFRSSFSNRRIDAMDFNHDGITDIISTAPTEYTLVNRSFIYHTYGKLFITFGGAGLRKNTIALEEFNEHGRIELNAEEIEDLSFGNQLRVVNDLNGDGQKDLLFSCEGAILEDFYLVYSGSIAERDSVNISDLNGQQITKVEGTFELSSYHLEIEDITGDGIAEFIHHDYYSDSRVSVIFGQQGGFGETLTVDSHDGVDILGEQGEYFGYTVANIGDINHDGFDDLGITNVDYYDEGIQENMYVIFGKDEWDSDTIQANNLNGTDGVIIEDIPNGRSELSALGDYNNDGIDDFVLFEENNQARVILGNCFDFHTNKAYTDVQAKNTTVITLDNQERLAVEGNEIDFNADGIKDYLFKGKRNVYISSENDFYVLYGSPAVEKEFCDYTTLHVQLVDENDKYPLPDTEVEVIGLGSYYTNEAGQFQVRIPEAGTYKLVPKNKFENIQFVTDTLVVDVVERGVDVSSKLHYSTINNRKDLAISISSGMRTRPGFDFDFSLKAINYSEKPHNAVINIDLPEHFLLDSTSVESQLNGGHKLKVSFADVAPFEVKRFKVYGKMSVESPRGEFVNFTAKINDGGNDVTDDDNNNNIDSLVSQITGSFDPNDKQAPATILPDSVLTGQYLEYLIRFQNTGNDTAFTVRVEDTLAHTLQWESFEMIDTSHPVEVTRLDSAINFTFNNILLVDSVTNEPDSHGYIRYKIRPQTTLVEEDIIENTAYIYFDFNEAVVTNTTQTIVRKPEEIINADDSDFRQVKNIVYPNPVQHRLFLSESPSKTFVQIYNTMGKLVLSSFYSKEGLDVSGLEKGLYILVADASKARFIKQ